MKKTIKLEEMSQADLIKKVANLEAHNYRWYQEKSQSGHGEEQAMTGSLGFGDSKENTNKINENLKQGVIKLSNDYQSIKKDNEFYRNEIKNYKTTIKMLNRTMGEQMNDIDELKKEIKELKESNYHGRSIYDQTA